MKLFGPRYPTLRQVIVNTKTGHAFRGVLWRKRGGYLVLRNAGMIAKQSDTRVPVDGELVIESSNVDFMQVVG